MIKSLKSKSIGKQKFDISSRHTPDRSINIKSVTIKSIVDRSVGAILPISGQFVYNHYQLSEKQIQWIRSTLHLQVNRTESVNDLIYGKPFGTKQGIIISEVEGRTDIVEMNYGFYRDGAVPGFYWYPVKNGSYSPPEILDRKIIGIIPYRNI